ncbi:hypothetical protein OOT46_27040 [Aquabacterium sp. A7-Y]|uniref:hypothetical protein n=1 Tax=Aquabacterium sp. A7-Y TaxID=1349605 RepID=UPI00223E18FD|nr:hypothetical protein [Aquabacterium sp. A7-Y]MCW7541470.1 hypothetical protein [Aquabacterium sp. A7-Y]
MEWLEPWSSTEGMEDTYRRAFSDQLAKEISPGHELYGKQVRLIARGNGDDALFELLDGTGRVAEVHLVWQGRQTPPWPSSAIFPSLEDWRMARMIPEHREWIDDDD